MKLLNLGTCKAVSRTNVRCQREKGHTGQHGADVASEPGERMGLIYGGKEVVTGHGPRYVYWWP